MRSSLSQLVSDATGADLDCLHWTATDLDVEPEQLSCLPHGVELPCRHCDQAMPAWKEERAAV